jgi:Bacterial regulatory helix-turn-helix protein, lysR family
MPEVNRLRVIDAAARHGSVTAAAKELDYSQPSVTHHPARLPQPRAVDASGAGDDHDVDQVLDARTGCPPAYSRG